MATGRRGDGAYVCDNGHEIYAGSHAPEKKQEPYYCTCSANGIHRPALHAKDCRMAKPEPGTQG
jgi:hypothetical protein